MPACFVFLFFLLYYYLICAHFAATLITATLGSQLFLLNDAQKGQGGRCVVNVSTTSSEQQPYQQGRIGKQQLSSSESRRRASCCVVTAERSGDGTRSAPSSAEP